MNLLLGEHSIPFIKVCVCERESVVCVRDELCVRGEAFLSEVGHILPIEY